ncbi:MAG: PAS domain S-box protein [Candidatus Accumulibacter phosphatis]|uniref:histidine kinase n=4 Tax=Candidatus Accumulibacter TaxID=327159 RepID=A0A7D5NAE1_9PROT|nr:MULTISPECIES: PAS domain S-box protein [Candidatus Accumulibacter]QLH49390.1 MAG: PAS domain S-box protein [Candidatus Accumulibacter cognatus]MBL8402558.1 PAS domain S-box protein [Accumulibacter sp.]MBO3713317.1 PAS domain S-box protein [Accumulibacter sp.]MCM8580284.1 PAS domain S-box protein [Accumulibacter sp.]MCM8622649.1 PAS domain S-box protein [Accumulibacter sp.]
MTPPFARIAALLEKRTRGGWVWVLPNLVLGCFVLSLFALLVVLQRYEQATQRNALAQDIQWAEQTIRTHLTNNQEFLQQLANGVAEGSLARESFQAQAGQYQRNNPELTHIVWVDADQVVRWTVPFETTAWNAGERLSLPEQTLTFQRANRTQQPAYSVPLVSPEGDATIEVHVPVLHERASRGAVIGIYAAAGVLRHLAPAWFSEKYRLVLETDEQVIGANSAVELQTDISDIVSLNPPGQGLRLRVSAYATKSNVPQKMIVFLIGGLVLLMAWSLWALGAHMRSRLRAERERDRLFNLSLDLLCVVHLDGHIVRANPAFERVLGLAVETLYGRPLIGLVHPDDVQATQEEVRKLARGEPSTGFDNRCRCADGTYRWLVWSVNPALEEGLFYCVAHDITERKRSEDAVRAEYAFRKAMEESVMTGLRAVDMAGRITYVNPAFCRMVGLRAEQLIGCLPPFPYWPRDDNAEQWHNLTLTLAGKAPANGFKMRITHAGGKYTDVRFYISPLIDADGKQTGWMASMVDITESNRTRAELISAHERFVTVLDGLEAAVYVADARTEEILYANLAFCAIFGPDAVGRNSRELTDCCTPESALLLRDPQHLTLADLPCELFDGELQNVVSERWYHVRDRAIKWVDARVVRMVIATDVTERRQTEDENVRQQVRLEQTSRLISMGEMASTLAHELNQPFTAISNYAMGCVSQLESGKYRREDLLAAMQKASFQAERAGKIVRRMRDFVRKSEPNRAAVALADIVEEAIGFAEIEARKAGVDIRINLPPALPPVYADRIMIEQVLLNLVKNGIEAMVHTPRKRRHLSVAARCNEDDQVEVEVCDNGHGIADEETEKLFMPFFTTKAYGMGMGLNICRTIVEFHNGRLWAVSNSGGGMAFRFTLPLGE